MIYVDTSVVVSALTVETRSEQATQWLVAQEPGVLLISPWVSTEFASAIGMKLRQTAISGDDAARATAAFKKLVRDSCRVVQVSHGHFEAASEFLGDHRLMLRFGDALHLAIAADVGATLATLDQRLFDAARSIGIPGVMP
jgi:predicted nucleic acid-binding protein